MNRPFTRLRTVFLAGILAVVPLVATVLAIRFLFLRIDSILGSYIADHLGRQIPGLGVAATVLLILLMGLVASNVIGRRMLQAGESLLSRLPLVRAVYRTTRDIVGALTTSQTESLREVVMIEYPRAGIYAYGFLTSFTTRQGPEGPVELANIYLPNPPMPTSGVLVAVPTDQVQYLDLSGEETMKLIVSGGLAAPRVLAPRAG